MRRREEIGREEGGTKEREREEGSISCDVRCIDCMYGL